MRVALLAGCAQQVLTPQINEATVRLLTRLGCEVVVAPRRRLLRRAGPPHGTRGRGRALAARKQHRRLGARPGAFDAVIANASGCGTQLKDYGFLLRNEPDWAARAAALSALARDVSEVVAELGLRGGAGRAGRCAGRRLSRGLLAAARPAHRRRAARPACTRPASPSSTSPRATSAAARPAPTTCCSPSSPTACVRARSPTSPPPGADAVAAGNVGCMVQIAGGLGPAGHAPGRAARLGDRRTATHGLARGGRTDHFLRVDNPGEPP